jgi:hypothetical protein
LRQEVLRLKFEEQTKRAAAQAAEGLVVGGLRPWCDVIEPHEDVASGNFQLAEFAAYFREVHAGTAEPEYVESIEFFRRTYLTRCLRTLLAQTMRWLNGDKGDPLSDERKYRKFTAPNEPGPNPRKAPLTLGQRLVDVRLRCADRAQQSRPVILVHGVKPVQERSFDTRR